MCEPGHGGKRVHGTPDAPSGVPTIRTKVRRSSYFTLTENVERYLLFHVYVCTYECIRIKSTRILIWFVNEENASFFSPNTRNLENQPICLKLYTVVEAGRL